ncbi:MAG: hypothetical protein NZM18_13635 [Thermoflexales bacterium]|nr:hypothetical protein [Thermoflexales bacterium]MDW8352096.1 hypothetical protein [Anaerolineae bacterium]
MKSVKSAPDELFTILTLVQTGKANGAAPIILHLTDDLDEAMRLVHAAADYADEA